MQLNLHFQASDLDTVPEQGIHEVVIDSARVRTSERGNPTIQVIYRLTQGRAAEQRVIEYFVVDGASAAALAISRRCLAALYRACGLDPQAGDEIDPRDLVDSRLEIRVGHESFDGTLRARVLGYRARS